MTELVKSKRLNECKVISLSKYDFEKILWKRAGKEILFNGKMYDVVHIETLGKTIKLYVESDDDETVLISDFINLARRQSSSDGANFPVKNLLQHFLQQFIQVTCNFNLFNHQAIFFSICKSDSFIASFHIELQSPPPKVA